jgi:putative heme-binding domain-containing protein
VQPTVQAGAVQQLLKDTAGDATLLPDAIRLATAWKAKEAAGELRRIAANRAVRMEAREAAIDGLAALGDPQSLQAIRELTAAPHQLPIRFRAATSLAQVDLDAGAAAAAKALAAAGPSDDPSLVIEAFLIRKKGAEKLAAALSGEKVSADTAKGILRSMYLAGHNDIALGNVASKFAGIDAAPRPPTADEVRKLMNEALTTGDAARGELVFRRADLGCMKCHAINKAGGHIGPDLGPIGGSSPMDYIIISILDPNASIKEEYLTKVISTTRGQIITGVVVQRNRNQVILKDATGKLNRIPTADIDEEANGKSLMPEGITRILTHAELVDLVRFVSELGKPGAYGPSPIPTVQRWKRLRDVPAVLREGVPNREIVRDSLLASPAEAWDTVFAHVNGKLPLKELSKPGRPEVVYLQGELQVVQGGPVEIRVEATEPVTFWVDEDAFERQDRAVVSLMPGRHRITVRATTNGQGPTLRVDLRRPADSQAHFEIVHED